MDAPLLARSLPAPPEGAEIALFGGSFNPPHVGHVAVVAYVLATEAVHEVWALPCLAHAFGKALAPFDLRARMLAGALAPFGGRARVCPIEAALGGTSRTVDTLRALHRQYPGRSFTWIAGSDLKAEIAHWKEPEEVQRLARFVWLPRRGAPALPGDLPALFPAISSSDVRARCLSGLSLEGWVPRAVLEILARERPYEPASGAGAP